MEGLKKQHIFLFGLLLAIFTYCYLCFFANPVADDFVFAYHFQETNFVELLKNAYLGWNGGIPIIFSFI